MASLLPSRGVAGCGLGLNFTTYVQVSVGGHSVIANAFQMDVGGRTSDIAALCTGMQLVVAV